MKVKRIFFSKDGKERTMIVSSPDCIQEKSTKRCAILDPGGSGGIVHFTIQYYRHQMWGKGKFFWRDRKRRILIVKFLNYTQEKSMILGKGRWEKGHSCDFWAFCLVAWPVGTYTEEVQKMDWVLKDLEHVREGLPRRVNMLWTGLQLYVAAALGQNCRLGSKEFSSNLCTWMSSSSPLAQYITSDQARYI